MFLQSATNWTTELIFNLHLLGSQESYFRFSEGLRGVILSTHSISVRSIPCCVSHVVRSSRGGQMLLQECFYYICYSRSVSSVGLFICLSKIINNRYRYQVQFVRSSLKVKEIIRITTVIVIMKVSNKLNRWNTKMNKNENFLLYYLILDKMGESYNCELHLRTLW